MYIYMYMWQSHDIVEIILLLTHVSITLHSDTHFTDTRDWHMRGYTHTYKSTVEL